MKYLKLHSEGLINVFCAICSFVAVIHLPIKYYTFLRVIVFIGCLLILVSKNVHINWKLIFIPILILFNPLFPIYLYLKSYWIPLDIVTGILFLLVTFYNDDKQKVRENKSEKKEMKNRNMYKIKH